MSQQSTQLQAKAQSNKSVFTLVGAGYRIAKVGLQTSILAADEVARMLELRLHAGVAKACEALMVATGLAITEGDKALTEALNGLTDEQVVALIRLDGGIEDYLSARAVQLPEAVLADVLEEIRNRK